VIKHIHITFPCKIELPLGFVQQFSAMLLSVPLESANEITHSIHSGQGYIQVEFEKAVDLPDRFYRHLDMLVHTVCDQYEHSNPSMVMWAAGHGSKPLSGDYSKFDDTCYSVSCCAREDYHGDNPYNPERDRLRAEARQRRADGKVSAIENYRCA
jgi:hypothetical protein